MKLQITIGDKTKNGKNKLTNVINIRAVKKLGFPKKLK